MSQEMPRYRCTAEKGFFSKPTQIAFAAFDYKEGVGQRAEFNDEFYTDQEPGAWMEPLNDAARKACEAMVKAKKRKTLAADVIVPTEPLKVPRTGMAASLKDNDAFAPIKDVRQMEEAPKGLQRAAPRRRAPSA